MTPIERVAIIGLGLIGGSIAAISPRSVSKSSAYDPNDAALDDALASRVVAVQARRVARRRRARTSS